MASLPVGTVTFLFTDVEGSVAHWEQHLAEMRTALAHHDEQDDAHVVIPFLSDRDAFHDLVERFDLSVDLGSADANATGIQNRIRSPVDNQPVVLGQFGEIPVAPDAGKSPSKT